MINQRVILLILAFVLFVLAGCNVQSRVNLMAFGLALWVLALVVTVP